MVCFRREGKRFSWAKVAFLGRCVNRMMPIIKNDWPDLPNAAQSLIASAGGMSTVSAKTAHQVSATTEIDQTAAFLKQAEDLDHRAAAHAIAVCGYAAAIPMIADMLKSTDLVIAALGCGTGERRGHERQRAACWCASPAGMARRTVVGRVHELRLKGGRRVTP